MQDTNPITETNNFIVLDKYEKSFSQLLIKLNRI